MMKRIDEPHDSANSISFYTKGNRALSELDRIYTCVTKNSNLHTSTIEDINGWFMHDLHRAYNMCPTKVDIPL